MEPPTSALLTDHYELTMVASALESGVAHRRAVFEVFARRLPAGRAYGVVAGIDRVLDAVSRFRFDDTTIEHLVRTGVVADVGEDDVYGRYVLLDHENGYRTRYAHASHTFVELGAVVRRDEVIALSGSTGRSTAPHLHFEIHPQGGSAINPYPLVKAIDAC